MSELKDTTNIFKLIVMEKLSIVDAEQNRIIQSNESRDTMLLD